MQLLEVRHETIYRYKRPVRFGEHRAMFRPRDSHDLRILATALQITPRATVRWMHDVFSNSISVLTFQEEAAELRLVSRIRVAHYGPAKLDYPLDRAAEVWPFAYSDDELADLGPLRQRHYPDTSGQVEAWARSFLASGQVGTLDLLITMTRAIKRDFTYTTRYERGTQSPDETLQLSTGTCRDFALLMMEAARTLGFAARFVSGYLYDPARDGAGTALRGAGATHAWVQIYLPSAGWVEFDPTNGIVGGRNLIRVAVARDPRQALPLSGSFYGAKDDFVDLSVKVEVKAVQQAATNGQLGK